MKTAIESKQPARRLGGWVFVLLFVAVLQPCIPSRAGSGEPSAGQLFAKRAESAFEKARTDFLTSSNETKKAWEFGRACFDWAEFSSTSDARETLARQGIEATRKAIAGESNSAPAHYYLAMNLGQLARTKSLGALKLVKEMEIEFKRAIEIDPAFDHAGAVRSLGILYLEAPGWPTSIGNNRKALAQLRRALELSPEFPENLISLAEAHLRLDDRKSAASHVHQLPPVMEAAKQKLAGEEWESSWVDWEKRAADLREKLTQKAPR